jgi:hypothetical protein
MRRGRWWSILVTLSLVVFIASGASSCDTVGGGTSDGSGATDVTFTVDGSTPAGVDITYGSDSSNYQGPSQPPMYKTLQIDEHALYYAVNAQLSGGGNVTCEIQIGDVVRTGHAVGGYNICSAQLSKTYNGGWG